VHDHEAIAFHESGHAVIHHYFGFPILGVEAGGGKGCCTLPSRVYPKTDNATNKELVRREIIQQVVIGLCAGRSAMERCCGKECFSDERWKNSDDGRPSWSPVRTTADDSWRACGSRSCGTSRPVTSWSWKASAVVLSA
jgi:hypothetical protein